MRIISFLAATFKILRTCETGLNNVLFVLVHLNEWTVWCTNSPSVKLLKTTGNKWAVFSGVQLFGSQFPEQEKLRACSELRPCELKLPAFSPMWLFSLKFCGSSRNLMSSSLCTPKPHFWVGPASNFGCLWGYKGSLEALWSTRHPLQYFWGLNKDLTMVCIIFTNLKPSPQLILEHSHHLKQKKYMIATPPTPIFPGPKYFLSITCFLETQTLGKVQHCQPFLLFNANEYNRFLNN